MTPRLALLILAAGLAGAVVLGFDDLDPIRMLAVAVFLVIVAFFAPHDRRQI